MSQRRFLLVSIMALFLSLGFLVLASVIALHRDDQKVCTLR